MYNFLYDIYNYDDRQINQLILEMYQSVFHIDMKDEFKWRFLDNPKGRAIGVVVFQDNNLVGHTSLMPCEVNIRDKREDAVISMGTMIHSDYAGQKIGTSMIQLLHQHLSESKYSLLMGFPNDNSFTMFTTRLGWTHIRDYHFTSFPNKGQKHKNHYELADINFVCLNAERIEAGICLSRDQEYLNWRYNDNRYEIFRSEEKCFVITKFQEKYDIVYWSPNVKEEDIRDFAQFIYDTFKVSTVSTWDSFPFSDKDVVRGQRGYHFCARKLKNDLTDDILIANEWTWLMGDSELF